MLCQEPAREQKFWFMMTWEILEFLFILHWNENETISIFSESRVILIQKNCNSVKFTLFCFLFRNDQKGYSQKPENFTCWSAHRWHSMCTHANMQRQKPTAKQSVNNIYQHNSDYLVIAKHLTPLASRHQLLATWDCKSIGIHFLVPEHQSS